MYIYAYMYIYISKMYSKENVQAGKASSGAPPNAPALLLFLHAARCLCCMPGSSSFS